MPAPEPPTRRFTLALTAAVAATTVAVGVTAATLLGWFRPAAPAAPTSPAGSSVVYVPIVPSAPPDLPAVEPTTQTRVAMDEPRGDAEHEHEHEREDDDE